VNWWLYVQSVVGNKRLWPRYVVLKVFCSYLDEGDLRVLCAFLYGNGITANGCVRLL
jgi:hypothetical protein